MATYRRPAVLVIQEFLGLVPALAPFTLPTVAVGPCYQLVTDAVMGTYVGNNQSYDYAGLMAGAKVDLDEADPDEQFPITKLPLALSLEDALLEIVASSDTGYGEGIDFSDDTADKFEDVLAGDILTITPENDVEIVPAMTDGISSATPGQESILTAGTPGDFVDVLAGDTVSVTGGTNTITGDFTVTANLDGDALKLDGNINDGGGASTDVEYSISGNRGVDAQGDYVIKTVTDDNNLILQGNLPHAENNITYEIKREVASVDLPDFTADEDEVSLASGITEGGFLVVGGTVLASYRALRNDKAASVENYASISALQADFGVNQITPQNPLAYGLSIMLQNTTTSVNGLGLDENAVSNEVLSHQNATDILKNTDMYAIVVLSQSPGVHQVYSPYVTGQSDDQKECVAVINRLIKTEETIQEQATTSVTVNNSLIVVNTRITGEALVASDTILTDATPDAFLNVQPGDLVVITGGTNAVPGNYTVESVDTDLTLSDAIVTADSTDIEYYIIRQDGLWSDGQTLRDRNATFITTGVAAGMLLRVYSGSYAGDYQIASVLSEQELTIAQVPGVTSLVTALDYGVIKEMSLAEQASFIAGYSEAFANRRLVNVWPDALGAPIGPTIYDVPGFYGGCSIGAMIAGLPTQQGFTNLSISGFLSLEHSSKYFDADMLDTIASGGTLILAQDVDEAPLYVRHQLTTDRSAIKFQELSVTKNVDYISKFLRTTYKPMIGTWNIIEPTMDEIKGIAKAAISFLKDQTRLPKIGGVIKSGNLKSLREDPSNIDTLLARFVMDIPIPLNNLIITVQV